MYCFVVACGGIMKNHVCLLWIIAGLFFCVVVMTCVIALDWQKIKIVDEFVYDAGEIYYDIDVGGKISHTFRFVNPFKTNMLLSLAGKSCGCVELDAGDKNVAPDGFVDVKMSFNIDPMSNQRNEMVAFKTNQKQLPFLQFTLIAKTIPSANLEVIDFVPPKLSKNESKTFSVKGTFYLDSAENTNAANMIVTGVGFNLVLDKPSIKHVGNKHEVTLNGQLKIDNTGITQFSSSKMYGNLSLHLNGKKIEKEVYWIPVFPFKLNPDSVFLSATGNRERKINIQFLQKINKLTAKSESGVLNVDCNLDHRDQKCSITVSLPENNHEHKHFELEYVTISTDIDGYSEIKIPVYVLDVSDKK
jgi:hypothetical protein